MIYLIHAVGSNFCKIGYTKGPTKRRLAELQTSCPFELVVIGICEGGPEAEVGFMMQFRDFHFRGEWFNFPDVDAALSEFLAWGDGGAERKTQQDQIRAAHTMDRILRGTFSLQNG